MKKHTVITIIPILLFLSGLTLLLYPSVSGHINSLRRSGVISGFDGDLARLSDADYAKIISAAREYNEKLLHNPNRFTLTQSELDEYRKILDFTGTGVIGTLEIDAIRVMLPVYLGTSKSVLQMGLGHFEGTSLPIGGIGTHSVICGHRATFLKDADRLAVGDIFVLKILNETLTYKIDLIVTVEPDNLGYLKIEPDKDLCTLVTCTPYGIDSHRLLLRGLRIFP